MALRDQIVDNDTLQVRLAERDGWTGDTQEITKTYAVDYHTGVEIIVEVAQVATELEHHPDLELRWATLRFMLTTHTAGDIVTELDFALADRIDEIAARHMARRAR